MKRNNKKLSGCFIAILLSLIFFIPHNVNAFASLDEVGNLNSILEAMLDDIDFLIPEYVDKYEAMRTVVANLTPEAMAIFSLFLTDNEQALETHLLHFDSDFQYYEVLITPFNSTIDQAVMRDLSIRLGSLGLSQTIINKLLAAASTMLAHPVITATVIFTVLTGVALYATFVGDWGFFSGVWPSIRSAFATSFAPVVSSSTVNTGFNNASTTLQNSHNTAVWEDLGSIASRHRVGQCAEAATAMSEFLRTRRLRGYRLLLNFPSDAVSLVFSLSRQIPAGNSGNFHTGVSFQNRAFCPVYPTGVGETFWANDFVVDIPIPGTTQIRINVRGTLTRFPIV